MIFDSVLGEEEALEKRRRKMEAKAEAKAKPKSKALKKEEPKAAEAAEAEQAHGNVARRHLMRHRSTSIDIYCI